MEKISLELTLEEVRILLEGLKQIKLGIALPVLKNIDDQLSAHENVKRESKEKEKKEEK